MSPRKATLLGFLLILGCGPIRADQTAISFTGVNNQFLDGADRMIGWEFTVGSAPIEVSGLGYFDFGGNGLAHSHQVGIWQTDQTLVGSAIVPAGTAAPLTDFFRYVSPASPFNLSSGSTYVIGALTPGGGDGHARRRRRSRL